MNQPAPLPNPEPAPNVDDAVALERIKLERERVALEKARFEAEQATQGASPESSVAKRKSEPRPAVSRSKAPPARGRTRKPRRERASARPQRSGNLPLILGIVALAGVVAGVGAFVATGSSEQPEEADPIEISEGPPASSEDDASPLPEPVVKPKIKDSSEAAQILGKASTLEGSGQFRASHALLEAWEREHGDSSEIVQARKQLLQRCRAQIKSETARATDLEREGSADEAIELLEELASRLPPPLDRELRAVIRGIGASPAGETPVVANPARPEDTPRPKPASDPAPPPTAPSTTDSAEGARVADRWFDDHESPVSFAQAAYHKSKYYLIKSNTKKGYTKRYAKMLDRYFKRYRTVFQQLLPRQRYEKSEIWIYATQREFMLAEDAPESTGGYYQPRTKRVVTFHGRFGRTGTTRTVLAHEATHQFEDMVLQGNLYNAPIWIIEGLAVLFESAEYDGKRVHIGRVPRDRLAVLKRGEAAGSLIPLRQLIRTPQPQFTGYHYAHAWGLIYMVLYSSDSAKVRRRNQKWFSDLFAAALKGPVRDRDVVSAMGGAAAFAEFEESWKAWIRDLPYDFEPKKR